MSNPRHGLIWMGLYLALTGAVCALLFAPLRSAFLANWGFNGLILAVLAVGIGINLWQVWALGAEVRWIRMFRTGQSGRSLSAEPRLLKPLARHLSRLAKDRFELSALSLRTVLDGIRERLDESREVSRYLIGLLVFLGLLGTFWGLLGTIQAVTGVIDALHVQGGDFVALLEELKAGLRAPLAGMGTAFSSSLFGLGGSLVLGFIDLQAGHVQNRFFNGLEEWLTGVTRLIQAPGGEGPQVDESASPVGGGALERLVEEIRAERELLRRLLEEPPRGRG